MKKILLTMIGLGLLMFSALAQARNGNVVLRGKVLDSIARGGKLVINVYADYTKFGEKVLSQNLIIDIANNGGFNLDIKSPSQLFYIDIKLLSNGRSKPLMAKGLGRELYLLADGDSCELVISFDKKSIKAEGRGAIKINCQNQLYRMSYRPVGAVDRSLALSAKRQFLAATEIEQMIKYEVVSLQLKILKSYQSELDKKVYDLIYMNSIGLAKQNTATGLLAMYITSNDRIIAAKQYFKTIYAKADTLLNQVTDIGQSAYYSDYIFELERTALVFGKGIDTVKHSFTLKDLYDIMKRKYRGALRDKLLLTIFYFSGNKEQEAMQMLKDAKNTIKTPVYKTYLESWERDRKEAFDFNLPDSNGKRWSLNNFRGKLVLVDFWFNGCFGCVKMKEMLEPLVEEYKNNSNVAFVSISVDPTRELWLSGIKKGIYTFPGQLNLYTEGLGSNHPIIKNYNFLSYPQLIIIDRKGKNVPLAVGHPALLGKEGIEALIKKHL